LTVREELEANALETEKAGDSRGGNAWQCAYDGLMEHWKGDPPPQRGKS
jgi:integrase